MMEPADVTARFDLKGRIYPLKFASAERTYPVESIGRSWQDNNGYHILVMTSGDRVFELIFSQEEIKWTMKRVGKGRAAV